MTGPAATTSWREDCGTATSPLPALRCVSGMHAPCAQNPAALDMRQALLGAMRRRLECVNGEGGRVRSQRLHFEELMLRGSRANHTTRHDHEENDENDDGGKRATTMN